MVNRRKKERIPGLGAFLEEYPGMSLEPVGTEAVFVSGRFSFTADIAGYPVISDQYWLRIRFTERFPKELPVVFETKGRIPQNADNHKNDDGSLCLGTPLDLLPRLQSNATIMGFAEACLIPYLYQTSHREMYGGDYLGGEVGHYAKGAIERYKILFRLKTDDQVLVALSRIWEKKNKANKRPCPCGCGKPTGQCLFVHKLAVYRRMKMRVEMREHARQLFSPT